MKPYILAMNFTESSRVGNFARGRGVAFAVASLSSGRTVFVTCRHNFFNKTAFVIFDENGKSVDFYGAGTHVLSSTREDLDVSLFVLPVSVPVERIRLSTQPIVANTQLSHAQNVVGSDGGSREAFVFTSKSASKCGERAICSLGSGAYEIIRTEAEVNESLTAGRKTFYGVIDMGSRPGVSGSPLWDKYGAIRGMVCGGNDETSPKPRLIYLPIRLIEPELKILLHNERMKKRGY